MAKQLPSFQSFLKEEIDRVKGVYYPVRASFLKRLVTRHVSCRRLHPNPEDEFCLPEIGPNYGIIARYEQDYKKDIQFKTEYQESGVLEPLIIQKAKPDGYLILNGHHRWAAAIRSGISRAEVRIVNLTQGSDVRKMLEQSRSDKRVALDLDEVVFCTDKDSFAEKPLPFPLNRFYRERVRKGIPALLHSFNERNYDIWVYTSKYCSVEYIRYYFKHWNVRLTGIVTGTARKGDREATMQELKSMMKTKYVSTIYIDNNLLIRTFSDTGECEEYPLSGSPDTWAREAMDAVRRMGTAARSRQTGKVMDG